MTPLAWFFLFAAIAGWIMAAGMLYISGRWQKLALSQTDLVRHYAKMLTDSIALTNAALAQRDAALAKLAERDMTSEGQTPKYH